MIKTVLLAASICLVPLASEAEIVEATLVEDFNSFSTADADYVFITAAPLLNDFYVAGVWRNDNYQKILAHALESEISYDPTTCVQSMNIDTDISFIFGIEASDESGYYRLTDSGRGKILVADEYGNFDNSGDIEGDYSLFKFINVKNIGNKQHRFNHDAYILCPKPIAGLKLNNTNENCYFGFYRSTKTKIDFTGISYKDCWYPLFDSGTDLCMPFLVYSIPKLAAPAVDYSNPGVVNLTAPEGSTLRVRRYNFDGSFTTEEIAENTTALEYGIDKARFSVQSVNKGRISNEMEMNLLDRFVETLPYQLKLRYTDTEGKPAVADFEIGNEAENPGSEESYTRTYLVAPTDIAHDSKVLIEVRIGDKHICNLVPTVASRADGAECSLVIGDEPQAFSSSMKDAKIGVTLTPFHSSTLTTASIPLSIPETGIDEVTSAHEYYNLQGIRIANPEPGCIYIVRDSASARLIRY